MWITLLKETHKSVFSKLQMSPPRSRTNPIKALINKMPASGAREKSTGRVERRITDLGLAYTSTPSKEEKKLFIYCLPASRVWVPLSISIHLYNCFDLQLHPSAEEAANYMSTRTCMHWVYPNCFLFHTGCIHTDFLGLSLKQKCERWVLIHIIIWVMKKCHVI